MVRLEVLCTKDIKLRTTELRDDAGDREKMQEWKGT